MINLPRKLSGGFRSRVINDLIDYCQSITPLNSASIRHTRLPNGVLSETGRSRATAERVRSFDVYPSAALKVKIKEGIVYLGGAKKSISGADFSSGDVEVTITPNGDHKCWVWVAINRAAASATLGSGDEPTNTDAIEYWILAQVTCNTTDTAITGVIQRWNCDIRDTLFS